MNVRIVPYFRQKCRLNRLKMRQLNSNIMSNSVKKSNEYQLNVLNTNANFKIALRSTGKALKILLSCEVLNSKQIAFVKSLQAKDSQAKFDKFDASIRRTKSNTITPFYLLQAMHKAMK